MTQYEGSKNQRWGHISYAQHFDDGMILNIFELLGVQKPTYLDIGAHHPKEISNTALLYERGCRGVNVEANPILIEAFKKQRPEDINVCVGVGPTRGEFDFLMYDDTSGLNTFDEKEALRYLEPNQITSGINKKRLSVITLSDLYNEVIQPHFGAKLPDLLTVDIEGWDRLILNQLPPGAHWPAITLPKLVVVETRQSLSQPMIDTMERKGFKVYCRMAENLFFVRNDLIERLY